MPAERRKATTEIGIRLDAFQADQRLAPKELISRLASEYKEAGGHPPSDTTVEHYLRVWRTDAKKPPPPIWERAIITLLSRGKQADHSVSPTQSKPEQEALSRGLRHSLLAPFLSWYYGTELWATDKRKRLPAVVFPLSSPADINQVNILAPWYSTGARAVRDVDLAFPDEKFLESRRQGARQVRNRQTYCLDEISLDGGIPKIKSNLIGRYEDCLATCDALEEELLVAFGTHPPKSASSEAFAEFAQSKLPLRQAATSFARERGLSPYMTGAGRSAAIAVSTLTIARTPQGSFVTFLGHRSAKTAVHQHLLHVVSSGMLQPVIDWEADSSTMTSSFYSDEWSLIHHVLQETAEELLGRDIEREFEQYPPETPDAIFTFPEVEFLDRLLIREDAMLFATGVLVNLLNLRPEVATVLIINNPEWYHLHSGGRSGFRRFQRNWEFMGPRELSSAHLPNFWRTPIWTPLEGDVSEGLLSSLGPDPLSNFVTPGAITLLLGLQFARTYLPTLASK